MSNESNSSASLEVMETSTSYSESTSDNTSEFSSLYQAIKEENYDVICEFLDNATEEEINAPIIRNGPEAGYTALHIACLENHLDVVKLLVEYHNADVNVVGDDGAQPIHLACLLEYEELAQFLLDYGGNIDAEIGREFILKYYEDPIDLEWSDDFGGKLTLLAYAVLNEEEFLTNFLMFMRANIKIKSLKNKTLLMYAVEKNYRYMADCIIKNVNDREYVNAQDSDGLRATHYILHKSKYGEFRYDETQLNKQSIHSSILTLLIEAGADIGATANGDPETLLLNMAAYRSSYDMILDLLPLSLSIPKSKALQLATQSGGSKYLRGFDNDISRLKENLEYARAVSTQYILENLVNRLTFGLPVPKKEKQLMDKLITTDPDIQKMVQNYEKNFIQGKMKNKIIKYGDKSITFYDLTAKCLDDKALKLLVKEPKIVGFIESEKWNSIYPSYKHDEDYFYCMIISRMRNAEVRSGLMKKLQKIPHLRKTIPLPYEIILLIIEYLDNYYLENFIDAFYTS